MTTATSRTDRRSTAKGTGADATRRDEQATTPSLTARVQQPILIQLGAALIARDAMLKATRPYRTRAGASQEITRQLRRFEQRGAGARTSIEGELESRRAQASRMIRRRTTDTTPSSA